MDKGFIDEITKVTPKGELPREVYKRALQDNLFSDYVKSLNIPDEIAYRYTDLLMQSCKEVQNCLKCKGINNCPNFMKGHVYMPRQVNRSIAFTYKKCARQEKIDEKNKHLRNIETYFLNTSLQDIEFKEIFTNDTARFEAIAELTKFIKDFPKYHQNFYIHGSFGCGKTYMTSAALIELAKKGHKSTIIFFPEFIRDIKAALKFPLELKQMIDHVQSTPVLLVDDIGAENLTAYVRDEIIEPILNYRMNNNLITIYTSNLDLKQLETHFSQTKDGVETMKAARLMQRINYNLKEIKVVTKNLRK